MEVKRYEDIFGKKLTVRDLIEDFTENTKTGEVSGFGGKLNIRPPYQREFVYEIDKQVAVIDTILNQYPLNVMYWAKSKDGRYELMDGQQRTISLCKFALDQYSIQVNIGGKNYTKTFSTLGAMQDIFLDYPLDVYICDGDEIEKLEWFKIINIAGVKLTNQEMRNAIYNGPWVSDAKRYFSRIDGVGYASEGHVSNRHTYGDYINVSGGKSSEKENAVVRQALLEIVLRWAVDDVNLTYGRDMDIEDFMNEHQRDKDAKNLWRYYEDVMEWVKETFPTYRKEMQGVEWGYLYNRYEGKTPPNADKMVNAIFAIADSEISNKKGVYEAALSRNMKTIHARSFKDSDIEWAFKKQSGMCPYCRNTFDKKDLCGDHIKPWSKGGITERSNLQLLCKECNLKKSNYDTRFKPWDSSEYELFDVEQWDNGEYDALK